MSIATPGSASPLPDPAGKLPEAPASENASAPTARQRAWRHFRRLAPWALSLLVLGLIARQVHTIDWDEVWQSLRAQSEAGLVMAAALAALSYALFASYDLVGRHLTGHRMPVPRTLGIAATCYAFNLNFGSLVGALALKLRLYGKAGIDAATTARVIGLSVLSNWLGYLVVGGLVLALAPPPMPAAFPLSPPALTALGAAMLLLGLAYVLLCITGPDAGRSLRWRQHTLKLPNGRVALWQLAVSAANWSVMAAIVWLLLEQRIAFPTVLGVLLLAAIAGVVTHVPAGLGVIEAVFIACLGSQLPHASLLAALLAYRATYYLLPLALATAGYFLSEGRRVPAASG